MVEALPFIIGLAIGVMIDLVVKGFKLLIDFSVDWWLDHKAGKAHKEHEKRKQAEFFNRGPGSYSTGGDMDPEQKDNMKRAFGIHVGACKPIPKYQPGTDETNSGNEIVNKQGRELSIPYGDQGNGDYLVPGCFGDSIDKFKDIKDVPPPSDSNSGTYRFKLPKGVTCDFGKGPSSTAWHVHLITDKGNVIVPGIDFLDSAAVDRAYTAYKASKAWDLALLLRSKGRKFLPSVNPLGDTAAFMKTGAYWCPAFDLEDAIFNRHVSFRHRKGGKRA